MALRLVEIYRPDSEAALEPPGDTCDVLGHWTCTRAACAVRRGPWKLLQNRPGEPFRLYQLGRVPWQPPR